MLVVVVDVAFASGPVFVGGEVIVLFRIVDDDDDDEGV